MYDRLHDVLNEKVHEEIWKFDCALDMVCVGPVDPQKTPSFSQIQKWTALAVEQNCWIDYEAQT